MFMIINHRQHIPFQLRAYGKLKVIQINACNSDEAFCMKEWCKLINEDDIVSGLDRSILSYVK